MLTPTASHSVVEQNWTAVQSRVRARWPQLSQQDLEQVDGDVNKLVALVHQKTGASVHEIEQAVDEIAASTTSQAGGKDSTEGDSTLAQLQSQAESAWHQAEDFYQSQPVSVLIGIFAIGLITGHGIGSGLHHMIDPPRKKQWWERVYR